MGQLGNRVVRSWPVRLAMLAIVVGAVALVSCSSKSDSGSESATASTEKALAELGDAFGAVLWEGRSEQTAPFEITKDDANCIGRAFMVKLVDEVGYDSVTDAGVTVEAFEQGSVTMMADLIDNDGFDLFTLDAFIECTEFMEALAAEVSQKSGWNESSWTCFLDSLLAEEETRQLVAWGTFTVGDLGAALGQLDPVILFDLFFACMTDEELTEVIAAGGDSELGVSEHSLSCLVGGLLAEEPTRGTFRQTVTEDKSVRDTIESLSADPAIARTVDDLVNTCFTDEEQASLLGI
jgi:hypothetical protein